MRHPPSREGLPARPDRASYEAFGSESLLQVLDVESWRKRLLQLVGLVGVCDTQSVQVLGATHFELGDIASLLNLH